MKQKNHTFQRKKKKKTKMFDLQSIYHPNVKHVNFEVFLQLQSQHMECMK